LQIVRRRNEIGRRMLGVGCSVPLEPRSSARELGLGEVLVIVLSGLFRRRE
jgi:hypothetical protein